MRSKVIAFAALSLSIILLSGCKVGDAPAKTSQSQANQKMADEINTKLSDNIASAQAQATKDKTASEILIEKNSIKSKEQIDAQTTTSRKLYIASNQFFGAYLLNTLTRPEYCSSLGAPINSFVEAYKKKNRQLFLIAEKVQTQFTKENGKQYGADKMYEAILPSLQKFVVQNMKDLSAQSGMTEKQVCLLFQNNALPIADEMDIKKKMPQVADVLLANS